MTSEQFVYWLNGALEIMDPKQLDEKQIQVIKDHIALVLKKETPDRKLPLNIIVDPKVPEGQIILRGPSPSTSLGFPHCDGTLGCNCITCYYKKNTTMTATC